MQAQFELFRFMLVRPPNDAGGKSVSVPGPTGLQKDVATASDSGSVAQIKKAVTEYTKSTSFARGLADLQNGEAIGSFVDLLRGATDPNLDDVKSWIHSSFNLTATELFPLGSVAARLGQPLDFTNLEIFGARGPLQADLVRVSDSILAAKLISDGNLVRLDELVPALLALMLIRRIAAGGVGLDRSGAVTEALLARISTPPVPLPAPAQAVAARARGRIINPPPPKTSACAELIGLKRRGEAVQQALIALRAMGAFDLNCPCPPLSAMPPVRVTTTTLSPTNLSDSALSASTFESPTSDPPSTAVCGARAATTPPTRLTPLRPARGTKPPPSPLPPHGRE